MRFTSKMNLKHISKWKSKFVGKCSFSTVKLYVPAHFSLFILLMPNTCLHNKYNIFLLDIIFFLFWMLKCCSFTFLFVWLFTLCSAVGGSERALKISERFFFGWINWKEEQNGILASQNALI